MGLPPESWVGGNRTNVQSWRHDLGHIGEEVQVGILFLQTEAAFDQPLLSRCSDF
jgi:hypothetical protein